MLVLDEPSTALAVSDVDRLFVFLRKLKAKGVAIIYVAHRMDEIARISDRATILRDGTPCHHRAAVASCRSRR